MLLCVFCKQKTAYEMRISDWSSDVCSSDRRLGPQGMSLAREAEGAPVIVLAQRLHQQPAQAEKTGLRLFQHGVEVLLGRPLVAVELRGLGRQQQGERRVQIGRAHV